MDYFATITALAALAVVIVQQILKLNVVPVYFANKFPVVTNIALSIIASIVVSWKTALTFVHWYQWVAYAGLVALVAAITYNATIKQDASLQAVANKTAK